MFKTNFTLKLTRLLLATLIEVCYYKHTYIHPKPKNQTKTMLCNRKQKNTQSFKNVSKAHQKENSTENGHQPGEYCISLFLQHSNMTQPVVQLEKEEHCPRYSV